MLHLDYHHHHHSHNFLVKICHFCHHFLHDIVHCSLVLRKHKSHISEIKLILVCDYRHYSVSMHDLYIKDCSLMSAIWILWNDLGQVVWIQLVLYYQAALFGTSISCGAISKSSDVVPICRTKGCVHCWFRGWRAENEHLSCIPLQLMGDLP